MCESVCESVCECGAYCVDHLAKFCVRLVGGSPMLEYILPKLLQSLYFTTIELFYKKDTQIVIRFIIKILNALFAIKIIIFGRKISKEKLHILNYTYSAYI